MYEIQCLDSYGNTIDYFTQWDIDQKVIIPISGYESCLSGKINQHVHFCNKKSLEALVVRATVIDDSTISAEVPNILLQDSHPLIVYVYLTDSEDVSSQKTILHNEIPIRKRVKPDEYNYVENIERITVEMIKEEIEADTERVKTEAINSIIATKNEATAYVTLAKDIYDDTVEVATQTKEEIENDIRAMMLEYGMELKTTDDGNGYVTTTLIIPQT